MNNETLTYILALIQPSLYLLEKGHINIKEYIELIRDYADHIEKRFLKNVKKN